MLQHQTRDVYFLHIYAKKIPRESLAIIRLLGSAASALFNGRSGSVFVNERWSLSHLRYLKSICRSVYHRPDVKAVGRGSRRNSFALYLTENTVEFLLKVYWQCDICVGISLSFGVSNFVLVSWSFWCILSSLFTK